MNKINLAICLMTCEIDHLEEWYEHHKNVGFKNFFIYLDSNSISNLDCLNPKLISEVKNIKIINTHFPDGKGILNVLYTALCKKYSFFDYILFIDSDEYYESKTNNIIEDINFVKEKCGYFDNLGIHSRLYGSKPPFENRVPINLYKQWRPCKHIKSLVSPKSVNFFRNPHFVISYNAKYIDEKCRIITSSNSQPHSSEYLWIKHVHTRSKSEWANKMNRKGWYADRHFIKPGLLSHEDLIRKFDKYNQSLTKIDNE